MKRKLSLLALALIACLTVQSCREMGIDPWDKGNGGGGNPVDTTKNTYPIEKLVGTKWRLTSIESTSLSSQQQIQPIAKEHLITLGFESPTHVSGMNICNSYGASLRSSKPGEIKFSDIFSTEAFCGNGLPDAEYLMGLQGATAYTATDKELRISYTPEVSIPEITSRTLVFAPLTGSGGNPGDELDLRVKQLAGHTYTLYSYVNAGIEEVQKNAQNCTITFYPSAQGKGSATILADCNKGTADLTFSADYQSMKLDNIVLTKMACQNQDVANRYVDFLRNTGRFEYSDYGTTLTIWTSLSTFAESKMVLKVAVPTDPILATIDIQDTPATGVPVSSYPMMYLENPQFDGKNIIFDFKYGGQTDDFRISAYSLFEFDRTMPPVVVVDLVTDGTPNPMTSLTEGKAILLLDGIRKRITTTTPGQAKMKVILRWQGKEMGQVDVAV